MSTNMKQINNMIKTVIAGHGDFGGTELLIHTIELVEKQKNK